MSKRTATTELNHDNWNKEESPEEPGIFKTATPEVIEKRVIRTAKRRIGIGNCTVSSSTTEEKKPFQGFVLSTTNQTSEVSKPDFSFLSNTNGMAKQTVFFSSFELDSDGNSQKTPYSDGRKMEDKKTSYFIKLKQLNEGLLDWITMHVKKDPYCILTPIFKDYEFHLREISGIEQSNAKLSSPNSRMRNIGDHSTNPVAQTSSPFMSKSGEKVGDNKNKQNIFGNSPLTGFSFAGGKTFTIGKIPAPIDKEPNNQETEDSEEPPTSEFVPVMEEDAVFSQRVKMFVKRDNGFSECGVGTLFIKPGGGKHQAVVRADTSLGNILLNILLTEAVPSQRVGKNNVMLVCIPTPDSKPPPVPVLLRVKTEKEADTLLQNIEKYKK